MAELKPKICPRCSTLLTIKFSRFTEKIRPKCEKCDVWYDDDLLELEQQRREKRLAVKVKTPKEDDNPIESPQGPTIFIPFIRGTSASMSEQFVNHGGRTGGRC